MKGEVLCMKKLNIVRQKLHMENSSVASVYSYWLFWYPKFTFPLILPFMACLTLYSMITPFDTFEIPISLKILWKIEHLLLGSLEQMLNFS